ncbi:MAG: metal ABC transporter ATP-binding protein [bacterium]|nr:metal ABC transporter ATP-binding protein [bacterium]
MANDPVIQIHNVSFGYADKPAVHDINLDVHRGEFLGIIGPNGSGKTTLLKILLGLIAPQKGSVQLFGQDITHFKDWSKIGYVPQKPGSNVTSFPVSVEEVVSMGGARPERVLEALAHVEMSEHSKRLLRELSGGQQQRVFIARALATKPELLILDEPTVGVDTDSQTKFYQLLKKLNLELKLTLVLVSHDIDVVAHEVSEIACINGTLICHGKPKDILKSDFMEKLYGKDVRFVVHGH